MTRVTRFAARDPGPAARVSGFVDHLRDNGLRLGPAETALAMQALTHVDAVSPDSTRSALKAVCSTCADDIQRFDELFDSYWLNGGRVRTRSMPAPQGMAKPDVHSSRNQAGEAAGGPGENSAPDAGDGDVAHDGTGKLVAARLRNLQKKDLRDVVLPEDIAEAERVARRLGAALRDRRSRRNKASQKGRVLHFRRVMRKSLARGGEPLALPRKRRPERPRKIVALCDVSGSMTVYARVFLAFLAGLMRADPASDAYLFHTRLVRISDALREKDALRALARMSILADGYGGGSRIGGSLAQFSRTYARRFVDGRSVVLVFSDGYDTDSPEILAEALTRLKRRGCKVIWLNPLKGWKGYEPVARGMAAALPHLDAFCPANRLEDLASLDRQWERL